MWCPKFSACLPNHYAVLEAIMDLVSVFKKLLCTLYELFWSWFRDHPRTSTRCTICVPQLFHRHHLKQAPRLLVGLAKCGSQVNYCKIQLCAMQIIGFSMNNYFLWGLQQHFVLSVFSIMCPNYRLPNVSRMKLWS